MTSTSRAAKFPRLLTWALRSLAALFAIITLLALSGAAYEAIASRSDATNLPPPGRLVDVGGFRLHLNCMGEGAPRGFGSPDATSEAMALLSTRPNAILATNAEARAYGVNDAELRASSLGDRPLIVLVSRQSLANNPHWAEAQSRHAALSSQGQMRIAEGSSHCIQCDEPRLVIAAVAEIVAEVRTQR